MPRHRQKTVVSAAALLLAVAGCGPARPTLAGGKPVAHWVEALRGPDARARRQAALKLGNVGEADPAAFAALREALHDPDPRVRREVILALLKCGPQAREVVPSLEQVRREDRDPQVRSHAARALEALAAEEPRPSGSGASPAP